MDGKELFFLHDDKVWAIDVKSNGSGLDIGNARCLFKPPNRFWWGNPFYDVTPDGKHFLMVITREETPAGINLVVNGTADLKRN